jgi:hypothetical protein
MGSGGRSQIHAPALLAQRQEPAAEPHGGRPLTPCHTAAEFFKKFLAFLFKTTKYQLQA